MSSAVIVLESSSRVIAAISHTGAGSSIVNAYLPRALGVDHAGAAEVIAPFASSRSRRALRAGAHERAGVAGAHAASDFEHTATELAFLERRREQGRAADDAPYRAARAALRHRVLERHRELRELALTFD